MQENYIRLTQVIKGSSLIEKPISLKLSEIQNVEEAHFGRWIITTNGRHIYVKESLDFLKSKLNIIEK
jgi:hypothetical protein